VEVLGNVCVAKIRASDATLTQIAALPGVIRLPKQLLSESLSDLTNQQKTAIVDKLGTLGYTTSEIRNSLGNNIGNKTLGDILKFAATRRVTPRREGDTLVFDGPVRPCGRSIESVDSGVSE
jgi:hypothetical protein